MKMLRAWFLRLKGLFHLQRREAEFAAEMESNLQMHIEDNVRAGMSPAQARREALLHFGSADSIRESYNRQSSLPFIETFIQDVRYGLRSLRKSPGFTIVAVLTLALGIGANTAIFSVINAVLLRPLPFQDPNHLVQLWQTEASPGDYPLTGPDYLEWQSQNQTLEASALFTWPQPVNASRDVEAQPVSSISTQANFFSVLGVKPEIGRTFAPGEDQPDKLQVVVLSHGFWKKFFGGRGNVLGEKILLNNQAYSVIGVMPDWFNFPTRIYVWIPLDMSRKNIAGNGSHRFQAVARVKPGRTIAEARADLLNISRRLEQQHPDNGKSESVVVPLQEQITGNVKPQLVVLMLAVMAVLLVACVNVANLLLARASGRQREIALRAVLGASRRRVIRQLLTESILLALIGAALGLAGAWWAVALIRSTVALPIPPMNPINVDATVLLFTTFISLAVGILFGLAPVLQASGIDLTEELKASAQSVIAPGWWQRLLRDSLVVGEIAVSLALLACAGLLLRSFEKMRSADIGIQPQRVMTMSVLLPKPKYGTPVSRRNFLDAYLERIQHIPGVQSAAIATELPLEGGSNGYIIVDGDTDPAHLNQLVEYNYITPDYFRTFGIPFLHGATFSPVDMDQAYDTNLQLDDFFEKHPDAKTVPAGLHFVAIINRAMAETFWPSQNAIGRIFKINGGLPVRVIGIVGNASVFGIQSRPFPTAYLPVTVSLNAPFCNGIVIAKTSGAPSSVVSALRSNLNAMDNSLAPFQVRTMEQVIDEITQSTSIQTYLLGSFAALALLLAAIGLYSVLAYLVTQRTREIGIRMALGAKHSDVLRLVMAHGSKLIAVGLVLGIAATLACTRLMESLLFGVTARDPITFISVAVVMAVVAMAACYVPVHRAMRVDPNVALRHE